MCREFTKREKERVLERKRGHEKGKERERERDGDDEARERDDKVIAKLRQTKRKIKKRSFRGERQAKREREGC